MRRFSKLIPLVISVLYLFVIMPFEYVCAEDDLAVLAAKLAVEQFTENEPANAVTKDLNLSAVNLPNGVTVGFSSSNSALLEIDGSIGRITRDKYIAKDVTLTVTLSRGRETAERNFELKVLSNSTNVYMSESFYYPEYNGCLITDVVPIAGNVSTSTSSFYGAGWSSLYNTSLDETEINGRRFKTLLGYEENEYCLYSYRKEAFDEYNYTQYVFNNKPTGKVDFSMRLKFAEGSDDSQQIYLFQIYANYLTADGQLNRFKPIEVQFYRSGNGQHSVVCNGQTSENRGIPETGQWFDCNFIIDLENQIYDFYIGGVKQNAKSVNFYNKGESGYEDCQTINDFQFNSYRTYGGGIIYLDDISVISDNSYYEENYNKLILSDMIDFSDIAFYTSGDYVSADNVSDNFTLNVSGKNEITDFMSEYGLSLSYESSDASVLSIDNNTVEVKKGLLSQNVTFSLLISDNYGGMPVIKDFLLKVSCMSGAEALNAAYQDLREEVLTSQTAAAITDNLTLPTFNGVTIDWSSSDTSVITNDGTVIRPKTDKNVTIAAKLKDAEDHIVYKELVFNVLSEEKSVYSAENFYHPVDLGKKLSDVTELKRWRNLYTKSEPRLTNTIYAEDNGNYVMKTQRDKENLEDYNFCSYNFSNPLKYNGLVTFRFKINNVSDSQIYVLQLFGSTRDKDNTIASAQVAEIQLIYNGSVGRVMSMSPATVLTNSFPRENIWHTAQFEVYNSTHTYDFYLDGEKLNTEPLKFFNDDEDADFVEIYSFTYNTYRFYGGGTIIIDDVSVVGYKGVHIECELYDAGLFKTDNPECIVSESMDAKAILYNCTNETIEDADIYLAVYQNNELKSIYWQKVTLEPGAANIGVRFSNIDLPDSGGVEVKAFLFDSSSLEPIAANKKMRNDLEDLHAREIIDSKTSRTYNILNLFGKQSVKGYFTQEGFSTDSTKLYFMNKDSEIYEYSLPEDKVKFIDRGIYSFNIVTTPLNNLFYINRDREVVKMNCDTYEKTAVVKIPEAYCTGKVSMLQVNNDESRLSVDWNDTGGTEEYGPVIDPKTQKRIPLYDMTENRWITDNIHNGFETQEYNLPNHININPSPEKKNLVMFAHEGSYVHDRIWVMDTDSGQTYNAFHQLPYTDKDAGESATHETWSYDGERILFCKSGRIGYKGIVTVRYDGTDRRYINSDYGYLHAGISPVTDRWIVSDTSYNGTDSDIVLVDAYTGDSYKIANVHQTGIDPGHCHPNFSQDGNIVYFGLYDGNNTPSIGWADVSDIISEAPEVHTYSLSSNCRIETAERSWEVCKTELGDETVYKIPDGGVMRVQALIDENDCIDANIVVKYFDNGTRDICLNYFVWQKNENGIYSLMPHTYRISRGNSKKWKTEEIHLSNINMGNMERLGSDFSLSGDGENVIIGSVYVGTISISEAVELISPEHISQEPLSAVTQDLQLPSVLGDNSFSVSWSSSDESVIDSSGKVTRHTDETKAAVLTAVVTNGIQTETVNYYVTVIPQSVNVYRNTTFYYPDVTVPRILPEGSFLNWWQITGNNFTTLCKSNNDYYIDADFENVGGTLTIYPSGSNNKHNILYFYLKIKTGDTVSKNGIQLRMTVKDIDNNAVASAATIGTIMTNEFKCGYNSGVWVSAGALSSDEFTSVLIKMDLLNNEISAKIGNGSWSVPTAMLNPVGAVNYSYAEGHWIERISFNRGSYTTPEPHLMIIESVAFTK